VIGSNQYPAAAVVVAPVRVAALRAPVEGEDVGEDDDEEAEDEGEDEAVAIDVTPAENPVTTFEGEPALTMDGMGVEDEAAAELNGAELTALESAEEEEELISEHGPSPSVAVLEGAPEVAVTVTVIVSTAGAPVSTDDEEETVSEDWAEDTGTPRVAAGVVVGDAAATLTEGVLVGVDMVVVDSSSSSLSESQVSSSSPEVSVFSGAAAVLVDEGAALSTEVGADADEELESPGMVDPSMPPVAPVAAIRDSASSLVSQLGEVPALATSGSEKHCSPALHGVTDQEPPTH